MSLSRGSAPIEFVLLGIPMIALSLGVIGFAMNGYGVNLSQDAAIEAAHRAAFADGDPEAAQLKVLGELRRALGAFAQSTVQVSLVNENGICLARSAVAVKQIGFGALIGGGVTNEIAEAYCEVQ